MKWCLKIILFFFATGLQAQPRTADRINITKAELEQKQRLSDFVTKIPKDCVIQHYQISCHTGGKFRLLQGKSDTLSEESKNAFKQVDFGSPLSVDIVYKCGPKQFAEILSYTIEKQKK